MRIQSSFLGLVLRSLTIMSKFVLMLVLAERFGIAEVGEFGLMVAIVNFFSAIIGLEIYQSVSRSVLKERKEESLSQFSAQIRYSWIVGMIAAAFIAWSWCSVFGGGIGVFFAVGFVVLLDLLTLEFSRLLFALQEFMAATVVLFLKNGVWALAAIVLLLLDDHFLLVGVYVLWAFFLLLAAGVGEIFLSRHGFGIIDRSAARKASVFRLAHMSGPFFVAAVAGNVMAYADKILFAFHLDRKQLGFFVLLASSAAAIRSLCFYGPASNRFPLIVKSFRKGDLQGYRSNLTRMSVEIAVILFLSVLLLFLAISFDVQRLVTSLSEIQGITVMLAMFLAIISSFGLPAFYALYAKSLDRENMKAAVLGAVTLLMVFPFFIQKYGLNGALLSVIAANAVVLFGRLGYLSLRETN